MADEKTFIVETSAHHVHITKEQINILFGTDDLHPIKDLSQPGQFAADEKVTVVGPKREIKNVRILGPARSAAQVEISLTEARSIGVAAPIRESGDIAGTPGCKLVGPAGEIDIEEGVIAAKRHIHMTPEDAENFGVENGEIVAVKVDNGQGRSIVFGDTVVRVSPSYALAMHIDTDESNAANASSGAVGEIIK